MSGLEAGGSAPDDTATTPARVDAAGEYRAIREAVGVVERSDLAHIVLHGRDPVRMVQGLITNDLAAAADDRVVYAAMLTSKGRTIAPIRAGVMGGAGGQTEVWIDVQRDVLAAATDHLRRSIPPLYAKWKDVSDQRGTVGVYGPRARELLALVLGDGPYPPAEDTRTRMHFGDRPVLVVGTRYAGGEEGFDLTVDTEILPELRDSLLASAPALGGGQAGLATLETLRIEAGRPRGGYELTEEVIPTEAFESIGMMDRAISFGKGCYTGQEVIVRIAHRGHVNRLLRGLVLPVGGAIPARGSRIFSPESGKDVGWITSTTFSPRMGRLVALGYVRRQIEPGDGVRIGSPEGVNASVTALPFAAEG